MNRPVEWNYKNEEGLKCRTRVTFFSGMIKWQFQKDKESWDYNKPPTVQDWEQLLDEIQRRHQRRRATQKELELTEAGYKQAVRNAAKSAVKDKA